MASITSSQSATARDPARDRAMVRAWLMVVALMIVAMVVVGGATRLTQSGLSITQWQPIHGVIPPLTHAQWQEEFARYQQIPQYQQLNQGMTLDQFKGIFWWEWSHRLLGRLIGAVVLLPLIFFWATGRIEPWLKPRLVALFLLGGLQGLVGWWMVKSGLSVRTSVSQYRLATHLTFAALILAYTVWLARGLAASPLNGLRQRLRGVAGLLVGLTFVQIFLGGLTAGLHAGLAYNTWPLMDGGLIPSGLFIQHPWWRNLFESVATVQFDHRLGAYVLFAVAWAHAAQARGTPYLRWALALAVLVTLQAALGITTLLLVVPVDVALTHQFGAMVVLIAAVTHLRRMWPAVPVPAAGCGGLSESGGLVETEHQVEVLHRGARRPLAEIVEERDQTRLARRLRAEDIELHLVGAVQRLRLQAGEGGRLLQRGDRDEAFAVIAGGERGMDVGERRSAGQRVERERHLDDHALVVAADGGREDRAHGQSAMLHDLRHMLVQKRERIDARVVVAVVRRVLVLEFGDQRLAAAGIAGDAEDGERRAGRHDAGRGERADEPDGAGRPAAGIGNAVRRGDPSPLALVHLRETEGPAVGGAMRGRGVDDPHAGAGNQADRLARRIVGQAEDDGVGAVEEFGAGRSVLALVGRDRQELEIGAAFQPLPDLQAGGAGLAVDEDCRSHFSHLRVRQIALVGTKKKGGPTGPPSKSEDMGSAGQRLENWKERRALRRPYFLRSTVRESRVRKPCFLSTVLSSGS